MKARQSPMVKPNICSGSYAFQFCEHPSLPLPNLTTLQEDIIPVVFIPDVYAQSISTTDPTGARFTCLHISCLETI